MRRLRETSLPEIDRPLLEAVQHLATSADSMDKYQDYADSSPILGRFASAAILPDVRALYDEQGAALETETQAGVLAYLERVDPSSRWRVEQAIATDPKAGTLLYELARANYSNTVDTILRTRLDDDDPAKAGPAAHVL